jgi:nicotinamide phosphoribosyltransferase
MFSSIKPWNFILSADGYKANHFREIKATVETSYSVIVPRKPSKYTNEIVAMGQTLVSHIFASVRITEEMIDEAEIEITEQGYQFNRKGWEHIARDLDGKLPLAMYGVEEGRVIKPQTPIVGIFNTSGVKSNWLPSYVETFTQQIIWKMSTVASMCRSIKFTMKEFMELTGSDMSMLDYKLHNFGDRGADSPEEAPVMAGIAHAALFKGSDCLRANGYIKKLYKTSKPYTSSVEATEHSVMCSHSDAATRNDFEAAVMAVDRLYDVVERTKQGIGIPLLSCVIDTYDSRRFVQEFLGKTLKNRIINSGGVFVCRPDSGDPTIEPGMVGKDIEAAFGVTVNAAGYKDLPPYMGVIQGDGNRVDTYRGILQGWVDAGFSINGFCLGMGSGITHDNARDDFSFSMKAVAIQEDKVWKRLLKEPITDLGKKSLSGLVRCKEVDGELVVYDALESGCSYSFKNPTAGWQLWFRDGFKQYRQSFDDVIKYANVGI